MTFLFNPVETTKLQNPIFNRTNDLLTSIDYDDNIIRTINRVGNLISTIVKTQDGSVIETKTFNYDSSNNITSVVQT